MEELKTIPNEPGLSVPALVAKALDQELNVASSTKSLPVNDLTSVVKKKKKPAAEAETPQLDSETSAANPTKRKAEDDGSSSPTDKRPRVEEETPALKAE